MTIRKIAGAIVSSLIVAANPAGAQTLAAPNLYTPSDGAFNWLFGAELFRWTVVNGATDYQIVLSDSPTFANFDEATGACRPSSTGCVSVRKNSTLNLATPGEFQGFWFLGTPTYYWKVRALTASVKSPWSPARSFMTTHPAMRTVLASATAYIGKAAPVSVSGSTWQTDMDGPMGTEIDNATKAYIACGNAPLQAGLSQAAQKWPNCRTKIAPQLTDDSVTEALLVERIGTAFDKAPSAPTTRDAYLAKLGFLASAKEFADRAITAGGLPPKAYGAAKAATARPGLYFFQSTTHAGIVRAVRFLPDGTPVVMVIEANYATTSTGARDDKWNRPDGAIPWQRTVRGDREVTLGGSNFVADPAL